MRGKTAVAALLVREDGNASMRPPQNAGENGFWVLTQRGGSTASMRPPQNAGENSLDEDFPAAFEVASMRPPQNAGENVPVAGEQPVRDLRFNEAPAECGGKH